MTDGQSCFVGVSAALGFGWIILTYIFCSKVFPCFEMAELKLQCVVSPKWPSGILWVFLNIRIHVGPWWKWALCASLLMFDVESDLLPKLTTTLSIPTTKHIYIYIYIYIAIFPPTQAFLMGKMVCRRNQACMRCFQTKCGNPPKPKVATHPVCQVDVLHQVQVLTLKMLYFRMLSMELLGF